MLPDLPFTEIMLMVGLESIESLHRCRQVCQTWNEKILRLIWENSQKKKLIKLRINEDWHYICYISNTYIKGEILELMLNDILRDIPSSEEVSHAKWLGKC